MGPVGVVESTISLDVLRKRSVYWKQPLLSQPDIVAAVIREAVIASAVNVAA